MHPKVGKMLTCSSAVEACGAVPLFLRDVNVIELRIARKTRLCAFPKIRATSRDVVFGIPSSKKILV
jgi:hypothetical protein